MNDKDRYKLYFGPYYPPKVRRGQRLVDEIRGTVVVGGYSDGKIVWPYVKRTADALTYPLRGPGEGRS